MRKHRIIHKPSKAIIVQQIPNTVMTADGRFYMLTPAIGVYVDMTPSVAIDEFTGAFDMNHHEVYENDLVEVGLHYYEDEKHENIGWVKAHAIIVYNELEMGWNLEVLTPSFKEMDADTEWDIHVILGNRWQSPEMVEACKMGLTGVVSTGTV